MSTRSTRYPLYNLIAGQWFDNGQAITLRENDVVSNWGATDYAFSLLPKGLYWQPIKTTRPGAYTCYKACRMSGLATFLNSESGRVSNATCNLVMPLALLVFLVIIVIGFDLPVDWQYVPRLLGF